MPKNLKILLLLALAVNAVHETNADYLQGELRAHSRYARQLEREGVLRIEHRQLGEHKRAVLVTEDTSSAFNGLSLAVKGATAFEQFTEENDLFISELNISEIRTEVFPQICAIRTVQRTYYDDEENSDLLI